MSKLLPMQGKREKLYTSQRWQPRNYTCTAKNVTSKTLWSVMHITSKYFYHSLISWFDQGITIFVLWVSLKIQCSHDLSPNVQPKWVWNISNVLKVKMVLLQEFCFGSGFCLTVLLYIYTFHFWRYKRELWSALFLYLYSWYSWEGVLTCLCMNDTEMYRHEKVYIRFAMFLSLQIYIYIYRCMYYAWG